MRYSISSQLLVFLLIILFLFIIQDGWKSEPKLDESTHKLYEFKMNGVFLKIIIQFIFIFYKIQC